LRAQLLERVITDAVSPDLALILQQIQRIGDIGQRRQRIEQVQQIQIDRLDPQAFELHIAALPHMLRREIGIARAVRVEMIEHLRADHRLFAPKPRTELPSAEAHA